MRVKHLRFLGFLLFKPSMFLTNGLVFAGILMQTSCPKISLNPTMKRITLNLSAGLLLGAVAIATMMPQAKAREYTFYTLAGANTSPGAADGSGSAARFNWPSGVAADSAGNLYVADTANNLIRKVTPEGSVTTVAGLVESWCSVDGTGAAAWFLSPCGVAADGAGNLYVADNCAIRKVTPAGAVTTLAGLAGVQGSADGTGAAARFSSLNWLSGVAVDDAGNVYVADVWNCTIRKVTPDGVVRTLAGLAGTSGSADGTGSAARFNLPQGLAVDGAGNLYVADYGNSTIRKVTPGGAVTTLAGLAGAPGSADGAGSAARFAQPAGVAVDGAGTVYVADTVGDTIRKVTPGGVVTTLAGLAGALGIDDGTGSAARFMGPRAVAVDRAGNACVLDTCSLRRVTPKGAVTTLAGVGLPERGGSVDGTGSAARFNNPMGVAVDSAGNAYVADKGNGTIRKVTPGGLVTTLAGLAGSIGASDGTGSAARFNSPQAVAVDGAGNAFVADTSNDAIRKVTADGVVTTVVGMAGSPGSNDGQTSVARLNSPSGLAVDSSGNLFVADTGNCTIRQITPGGVVTTLAGVAGSSGNADGTGNVARFAGLYGMAMDPSGNLFVTDGGNHAVRKVTPSGVVTTLAGWFDSPGGVAVDSAGNVYVTDDCSIGMVTPAGVAATVAGLARTQGGDDGSGSVARFDFPAGLAVDTAGNLYVADTGNCAIRIGLVACPDTPTIDLAIGAVGQTRQLDTRPQTAVAWRWRLIRNPAASSASLSAANIRNPTFTPDVPDLYVFQLEATNAAGQVGLRTLAFRAVPGPSTPGLLATAHLAGSAGGAVITNSFHLTVGFENPPPGSEPLQAPLFDNLTFYNGDVGHTFTVGPGDDPAFAPFVAMLTDGLPNSLCYDMESAGGSMGCADPEARFFIGLPPGNNGSDLAGFNIDHVSLRFDAIDIVSPGQNPRGDGIWTDCSFSAAFCVYGWPVLPPSVDVGPTNQSAIQGASTVLSAAAAGYQPLSYQWFFNVTNSLPGATNSALALTNIQLSQAGAYTVVVTNVFGAATSPPAFLTVIGVPPGTTAVLDSTEGALRTALAAGGRVVFLFDGVINVSSTVTITTNALLDGNGHRVTISGNNETGVFSVPAGVTFGLAALTIANGRSSAGGGVLNDGGALDATNCVFYDNSASGTDGTAGSGGAIYNTGSFKAGRCVFYANSAWGANGTSNMVSGADGSGGAIYNAGSFDASQCAFGWNYAQGGNPLGGQSWSYGSSGGAGQGGAIYNTGVMVLHSSLMASNWVNAGNGSIGFPGRILYGPGNGGSGGAAGGGAVCNSGTGVLVNCTLAWNQGTGGQGGEGGPLGGSPAMTPGAMGGDGGSAAGAVANVNGLSALTNCTLAFNTGAGGDGGLGGYTFMGPAGSPGRDGDAVGGIRNTGTVFLINTGSVLLVNCILASNSGASGQGGPGFGTPGVGVGNLQGLFTDLGHNLSSDASVQLTGPGSLVGVDPKLGPLGDNGGLTWTLPLLPSSPAIGAADSASAPPTDQRGFPRPAGSADIGAYEFGYPPVLQAALPLNGGLNISVAGRPGQVCQLLVSPDLVNWSPLATNSFDPQGAVLFRDAGSAGQPRRFYRAVMP
jgi:sugar lactone lactonase YvrE